ncbi:hypothetical protein BHE74_00010920 [Ensete ventricosum]|nr:hypothetical protein BHE74_00010920 [Ensete ventricosum]
MKRRHETFLRGQGHELMQRKERDRVVPWGLHFDRANSSCMVPKTKGASRYMHLISEKHLTEELRRLNWLRRNWDQKALARDKRTQRRRALVVKGAEMVENAEANSMYQDKAEEQRLGNFIRLVSTDFSSSGKAPYHPIRTGMAGDRYADRPLQGGTAKIDRRRLISAVSGRLKKKR